MDLFLFTGSLFSLIYFARLLAVLVGSVLFNQLYAATITWYRGFCFTFAAGLLVIPRGSVSCKLAKDINIELVVYHAVADPGFPERETVFGQNFLKTV